MDMKQCYISDTYHIMYLTFSKEAINEIFAEAKYSNDVSDYKKEEDPEYLEELVKEYIYDQINDLLTKIDVMPLGKPIIKFMKKVKENNSLLVIVKTCVLPIDLNLHFPVEFNVKFDTYLIEESYQKIIINEMLYNNFEYQLVPTTKVSNNTVVHYHLYFIEDDITFDTIEDQVVDLLDNDDEFMYINLLNHRVGDEVVISDGQIKAVAKITKILKKKLNELTDLVVLRLGYAMCSTTEEFKNKIREVQDYTMKINAYSNYIVDYIIKNHDFDLDDDMKRHYLSFDHELPDKIYLKKVQRDLIAEAIGSLVSLSYEERHPRTFDKLAEEMSLNILRGVVDPEEADEILKKRENDAWIVQFFVDQKVIQVDI